MDDTNTQNKEPAAAPKLDPRPQPVTTGAPDWRAIGAGALIGATVLAIVSVPVIAAIGVLRGNPIAFGDRRRVIVREV